MALFQTNNELKLFYPARMTLDMADVLPTMERVEQDYLVAQVLGEAQYNELHTAYQADAMTPRLDDLIAACRPVVANMSGYHYAAIGALHWTSGGFVATNSGGDNIASQVKVDELKRELLGAGFSALDRLLGFLQARISDFPLWAASVFASYGKGLLRTTAQFHAAVDIANSHWLFWRMRSIMERHQDEDSLIAKTLCSTALYDQLTTQSNGGDVWTGTNAKLIKLIRPAVAHLTMCEAVTELSLNKDSRGVWVFSTTSGAGPMAATDARLDTWKNYHRDRAAEYVQALDNKLKELAAAGTCALYLASACYTAFTAKTDVTPRDTTRMAGGFM